jgi:hypothetical protein
VCREQLLAQHRGLCDSATHACTRDTRDFSHAHTQTHVHTCAHTIKCRTTVGATEGAAVGTAVDGAEFAVENLPEGAAVQPVAAVTAVLPETCSMCVYSNYTS